MELRLPLVEPDRRRRDIRAVLGVTSELVIGEEAEVEAESGP